MVALSSYKLVAVIPHFHKERKDNVQVCVDAINLGSLKPDLVVVFNNNPEYQLKINGAICINSEINLGSSVRYAIAYQLGATHMIGHDDDLMLGYTDVETLVEQMNLHPESIIGFCGADMGIENPYLGRSSYIAKDKMPVEVVLGRVSAMSRNCLSRYMRSIESMDLSKYGNHEDIPASLENIRAGNKNYIVPLKIRELQTGGVGLEFQDDHFTHRNDLAKL